VKALYCRGCGDIRAPHPRGLWTHCLCGRCAARWEDPERGLLVVASGERDLVRVIGVHNLFLGYDGGMDEDWRQVHEGCVDSAEGYVFHRSKRACPVAIMRVGQTADIRWATPGEQRSAEEARADGRIPAA
jgi:hypothetical protein